ncbi:MAG TPA: LysE family transporter [Dehalococcoidia bacterium]|nr:LysE family transporter [Dehalococcoidia bacterium]
MLPILLSVVVISSSGVMMPGPMLAVTLAKSYKSPWTGAWLSLGHAVIEVPLILLIYFGFAHFFQVNVVRLALSVAGSGMIIWMGVSMFRARGEVAQKGKDLPYNAFTAGILTSVFNPFFVVWWATLGSMLIMRILDFGTVGIILFTIVHWLCDLVWLTLISNVIYRTHAFWNRRVQEWLFITGSLLLIGFGIWFLVSGIQLVI